jgi:hypothetical protein
MNNLQTASRLVTENFAVNHYLPTLIAHLYFHGVVLCHARYGPRLPAWFHYRAAMLFTKGKN